jgi:hypothetical protein
MASMNYLVFLDASAGELEKILSGVKSMVVKEFDPAQTAANPVNQGDGLYFLRDKVDCAVRVKATVVRVFAFDHGVNEGLSHILKELQTRLQLTEEQYNHWSTRKQALFVEFEAAQKIPEFHISVNKITDRTRWIVFEEIREVTEEGVKDETSNNFTG